MREKSLARKKASQATSSSGGTHTTQQLHLQLKIVYQVYLCLMIAIDPSLTCLTGFEGATAISSNAYFGRPEDDLPEEDYGDLETAAKDFVRKFGITAGDDLENLTSMLGEGATKLQGAVRNYLNS
jgi:hypothetical protein